jgi:uncharacterized membrane protein YraQ (UPF0718 family)
MQQTPTNLPSPPPSELERLFDSPAVTYIIAIAGLLIIVSVGYYMMEFFRNLITGGEDATELISEVEQLKSSNYISDEERKRLNLAAPIAALADNEKLDPELGMLRKIREAKKQKSNNKPDSNKMFEEILGQINDLNDSSE